MTTALRLEDLPDVAAELRGWPSAATALETERPVDAAEPFPGVVPVRPDGILARVRRSCADHDCDCPCVGHLEEQGCLVFWCAGGAHHLTFRS